MSVSPAFLNVSYLPVYGEMESGLLTEHCALVYQAGSCSCDESVHCCSGRQIWVFTALVPDFVIFLSVTQQQQWLVQCGWDSFYLF